MNVLEDVVNEELRRLERLSELYKEKMDALPRGSISVKNRGSRFYCYLVFREGAKVKYKYLGKKDSPEVMEMEKKIHARKKLEAMLEKVKENRIVAGKMIRAARNEF